MKHKPNRYPKISLEQHLKLDDDMRERIGQRLAKHEKQQKEVLSSYNPNQLSKSFKNVASLIEAQSRKSKS